ncbi:TonB-dependent receptor [Anaeromyxobacter diazotrophicus]|uniref:TonB-dependent receptor n=1 Tax=Anaeromyxobacter diazotrophicus TaxID=2590199 RepID=A0A7I9VMT3_9BACT|nr:TonB-dependent receptor [Anaeromyxobacter diazotrophicus]
MSLLAQAAVPRMALADTAPPPADRAERGAAPPERPPEPIYETVVSGLRLPRPQPDTPPVTTVIAREEIAQSPATTADELVRAVPSVAVFRRSASLVADPSSQTLNLRGVAPTGVSRALVLQDGVPLNDPFGGWISWRALPLLGIGRVEIVPSGASALYGNLALGGVAQVFSRPIGGTGVETQLAGGSFRTGEASLRLTGASSAAGGELLADVLTSDGYSPIAPAQRGPIDGPAPSTDYNVSARVEARAGPSLSLRGFGRFFHETLEAGTLFTSAAARAATYGVGARLELGGSGTLDAVIFAGNRRFEQQRARVSPDRSSASPAFTQHVPSDNQGASVTWTLPRHQLGVEHVLLFGIDAQRVAGTSTEDQASSNPTAASIASRSAGGEQQFAGVFAQDAVRVGRVEASAAVRLDGYRDLSGATTTRHVGGAVERVPHPDRSNLQVSPRLGVLVHVTDVLALRGSVYRAFRAPTLDELYRPFQVGTILTDGNAALEPETLWGGEAGAEAIAGGLTARATGFWNQLQHPINNVTLATPAPDGATRQRQNLGEARIRGVELEVGWRPTRRWKALAAYTFVDPVTTSAPGHPELVGKQFPQDPRHRASFALTFDARELATLTGEVRAVAAQYEDDRNTLPMGAYAVVNLAAARELARGVALFATAANVFDASYLVGRAGVDTVGQPRTLLVGMRFASGGE